MKHIKVLILFLLMAFMPLAIATGDNELGTPVNARSAGDTYTDYYRLMKDCKHNGGNWILYPCPEECERYYGYCEYPTPIVETHRNPWKQFCNLDINERCQFRFKIDKTVKFIDDKQEYSMTYVSNTKGITIKNIFRYWVTRDPVVSIKDKQGNEVFNGVLKEGNTLFKDINVNSVKTSGYFLWVILDK